MAKNEVFYPAPSQSALGTGLVTVYTVTAGRTCMQMDIIACNFSAVDTGYDLKAGSGNKSFWRGSATAAAGKLPAGGTEIWHLNVRLAAGTTVQARGEFAASIGITISPAEKED